MTTAAGNALASHNGTEVEKLLARVLGIELQNDYVVDGMYRNTPVEIKSCQDIIQDRSHINHQRTGRFVLTHTQHQYLVENDGVYVFVVRDTDGEVVAVKAVKAVTLDVVVNRQTQVIWKDVVDLGDAECSWEAVYEVVGCTSDYDEVGA
jgi:hypothetical protein